MIDTDKGISEKKELPVPEPGTLGNSSVFFDAKSDVAISKSQTAPNFIDFFLL